MNDWRKELRESRTDLSGLNMSPARRKRLDEVLKRYPMRIPPHLAGLMQIDNPRCPVHRQMMPDTRELNDATGEPDPLDEERHTVEPGVIRRFSDRLLALVSLTCPVLCRHCNRKRLWGKSEPKAGPETIGRTLAHAPKVREVILSGGEPLMLSDAAVERLLQAARSSENVELVRIHTRMPVSVPSRVTSGLLAVLRRHRPLWLVTHFNHAREVSPLARRKLLALADAGISVLNQAVLLKGVNDSMAAQAALGRALVTSQVRPYYLFQLDRALGTTHFQVPLRKSLDIIARLRAKHSGLIVPHLMADLPGPGGKVPITPNAVVKWTERGAVLKGADGREYLYPN
jgi:lysine 2,3-aminomutase